MDIPGLPARKAALRPHDAVLRRGETLDQAAGGALLGIRGDADRGLARPLAGESLRWLTDLDELIDSATRLPLADDAKARAVLRLMLAGWLRLETPPHAVIATGLELLQGGPRYPLRPREASPKVKAWIKAHAVPLSTVEPGAGFADMQPLRTLVGSARVVSLGEATHGTRELFLFKGRMLEFLVEEMGFRVFAIEANQPEARAVNDCVLRGEGDPAKALKGLYFWTWDTEEILGMIHWMRRYNLDPRHAEKLKFYGFDMQVPDVAWRNIKSYLDRVDSSESSWMDSNMKELGLKKSQGDRARLALPADRKAALLDAADALVKRSISTKRPIWRHIENPIGGP